MDAETGFFSDILVLDMPCSEFRESGSPGQTGSGKFQMGGPNDKSYLEAFSGHPVIGIGSAATESLAADPGPVDTHEAGEAGFFPPVATGPEWAAIRPDQVPVHDGQP